MRCRTAVVILLSAIALAVFQVRSAAAEDLTYDPESCAVEANEKVYVTFYGKVFAFPYEHPMYVGTVPPQFQARVPDPISPNEPRGCPGHPIEGTGFSFAYYFKGDFGGDVETRRLVAQLDTLQAFAVRPEFWGRSVEPLFDRLCERTGIVSGEIEGFDVCYALPPEGRTEPSSRILRARPAHYAAPFGRPFIVECHGPIGKRDLYCDVTYKLYQTINIVYRFSTQNVPLVTVVDLDKAVRHFFESARREDLSSPTMLGGSVE
jgi:hypothetical protein